MHQGGVEFEDLAPGPAPQLPLETFEARRQAAAARLEADQVLVVATHPETTYSNDVEHRFRPHSDFWYLTGFAEPGCVLTLRADGRTDLWLRPRQPEAEVWTGRRLGIERAGLLGVDGAHDSRQFEGLKAMLGGHRVLARTAHHAAAHAVVGEAEDAAPLLAGLRVIKDEHEIAMLRKAAEVGGAAMLDGVAAVAPGAAEYEVEAALIAAYRRAGSTGPGYPPIVGTGANASVLHYIENRATIRAGELVLIDAGCEWGYYNSDITRTVPAGPMTSVQAELFAAVERAQAAALSEVRPGNRFRDPHDAAVRVLVDALVDLGFLEGDKDRLIEEQAHRSFYMHGTSHFLGLDVHDAGAVKDDQGQSVRLREGMCLTVEPGLYFNTDFATCPPQAAGIGIRLENDIVVTGDGHLDLQAGLPTSPDELVGIGQRPQIPRR